MGRNCTPSFWLCIPVLHDAIIIVTMNTLGYFVVSTEMIDFIAIELMMRDEISRLKLS